MDEYGNRLIRCFAAVFPRIAVDQIREASVDKIPEWDSLAAVTLVALIEEEFGAQVDFGDLSNLTFIDILNYLKAHKSVL
jgi:acyl carrier protein